MTTKGTTEGFGPFGVVLAELMRPRGLDATHETVRTLALDAGIDPEDLEIEMYARPGQESGLSPWSGDNHALGCLTWPSRRRTFTLTTSSVVLARSSRTEKTWESL